MAAYGNALNVFSADVDVETLIQTLTDAALDLEQ